MSLSGRRLKRYLGFKREKLKFNGGIELLLTDRIVGWVYGTYVKLEEVRLYFGSNLVSKAPIDKSRSDVFTSFNYEGNPGFELDLPTSVDKNILKFSPKLVAISYNSIESFELSSIDKSESYKSKLISLFKSEFLGLKGHFDGFRNDGNLYGWAGKLNNIEPISIFLQCEKRFPIKVLCNRLRNDIDDKRVSVNSGFMINLEDIPIDWLGCEIFCSFDESGYYKLPQSGLISLEQISGMSSTIKSKNNLASNDILFDVPLDYKDHWKALEDFNNYLCKVEKHLKDSSIVSSSAILNNNKKLNRFSPLSLIRNIFKSNK